MKSIYQTTNGICGLLLKSFHFRELVYILHRVEVSHLKSEKCHCFSDQLPLTAPAGDPSVWDPSVRTVQRLHLPGSWRQPSLLWDHHSHHGVLRRREQWQSLLQPRFGCYWSWHGGGPRLGEGHQTGFNACHPTAKSGHCCWSRQRSQ